MRYFEKCTSDITDRYISVRGPGNVVGIATGYGLDGPGDRIPVGGGDFPHLSRPVLGPTQPPVQ